MPRTKLRWSAGTRNTNFAAFFLVLRTCGAPLTESPHFCSSVLRLASTSRITIPSLRMPVNRPTAWNTSGRFSSSSATSSGLKRRWCESSWGALPVLTDSCFPNVWPLA